MPYTYVKLGSRGKSFKDERSNLYLPNRASAGRIEDFKLNDRITTALAHGFLVQIGLTEYETINSISKNTTGQVVINTETTQSTFEEAIVFKDVIGPQDSPPNGALNMGNSYLIGSNPLNEWVGRTGYVASWSAGAWLYKSPEDSSIALLKLYPGYFYFYSGTFPNGIWKKYPTDPINIPTINDITSTMTEGRQQQVVNNFFTNYYNTINGTKLAPLLQFVTTGIIRKYTIDTKDPIKDVLVIVESQPMYELEGQPWGYRFDRPSKTIYFNADVAPSRILILYYS